MISEYTIIFCAAYSLIMLGVSIKLKVPDIAVWLSISIFSLSVFVAFEFFNEVVTLDFVLFNFNWQHVIAFASIFPMAVVLRKIGLNKVLLFWGKLIFGLLLLLTAQSFFTGFSLFFQISGNKVTATIWYVFPLFTMSSTVYIAIIINLFIRFRIETDKFTRKLIKTILVAFSFLALFGIISMLFFSLYGLVSRPLFPLSLPGIIIYSVASFSFITELIYHKFTSNYKKKLFLKEVETRSPDNKEFNYIIDLIKKQQLYLNPDISLQYLAEYFKMSRNELSQLINRNTNSNFNQFVNKLRLEAFCKQLVDEANRKASILDIAYASGFNSKSTFQRTFREYYKISPREYRKLVWGEE
jgi:AraC-like DNA-binding protein